MSEQKVKAKNERSGSNSNRSSRVPTLPTQDEMTREQALAVIWTGLRALALQGQLITFNDVSKNRAWFGIANAKLVKENGKVRLVDLLPTLTANAPSVGSSVGKGEKNGAEKSGQGKTEAAG